MTINEFGKDIYEINFEGETLSMDDLQRFFELGIAQTCSAVVTKKDIVECFEKALKEVG